MSTIVVPEFRISRNQIEWRKPQLGYHYRILFEGERPEGHASLFLKTVFQYSAFNFYQDLMDQGISPHDILAHLNGFYPNGRGLHDSNPKHQKLMRSGVGKRVLEQITDDALEHDAKVMYIFTRRKPMSDFLTKNGFTVCQNSSASSYRNAYKIL